MPTFEVKLVRTMVTVVTVEAETKEAAWQQVADYGPAEAWGDYPSKDQEDLCRIKSVRRKRKGSRECRR